MGATEKKAALKRTLPVDSTDMRPKKKKRQIQPLALSPILSMASAAKIPPPPILPG